MHDSFSRLLAARSRPSREYPHQATSIGPKVGLLGGRYCCWEPIEQAKDDFDQLLPEIHQALHTYCPRATGSSWINIEFYMLGRSKETATPTIVFVHPHSGLRKEAMNAVRKSECLKRYPGFKVANHKEDVKVLSATADAFDIPDTEMNAGVLHLPTPESCLLGSTLEKINKLHQPVYYNPKHCVQPSGLVIFSKLPYEDGITVQSAWANFVLNGDKLLCQSVSHIFSQPHLAEDSWDESDDEVEIASDSEDEEDEAEMTSQGSMTPEVSSFTLSDGDDVESGSSWGIGSESSSYQTTNHFARARKDTGPTLDFEDIGNQLDPHYHEPVRSTRLLPTQNQVNTDDLVHLGNVLGCSVDKDWSLITITNPGVRRAIQHHQDITISNGFKITKVLKPSRSALVVAQTPSSGQITGKLIMAPAYSSLPGSHTFQQVYRVQLDGSAVKGDCGSPVVDAETHVLYGYIVAGSESTGMVYVMAAHHVIENIEQQMGYKILFHLKFPLIKNTLELCDQPLATSDLPSPAKPRPENSDGSNKTCLGITPPLASLSSSDIQPASPPLTLRTSFSVSLPVSTIERGDCSTIGINVGDINAAVKLCRGIYKTCLDHESATKSQYTDFGREVKRVLDSLEVLQQILLSLENPKTPASEPIPDFQDLQELMQEAQNVCNEFNDRRFGNSHQTKQSKSRIFVYAAHQQAEGFKVRMGICATKLQHFIKLLELQRVIDDFEPPDDPEPAPVGFKTLTKFLIFISILATSSLAYFCWRIFTGNGSITNKEKPQFDCNDRLLENINDQSMLTLENFRRYDFDSGIFSNTISRINTWIIPVTALLAHIFLSPINKRKCVSIVHFLGDPIDSFWSLIHTVYIWRRKEVIASNEWPQCRALDAEILNRGPNSQQSNYQDPVEPEPAIPVGQTDIYQGNRERAIATVFADLEEILGSKSHPQDYYSMILGHLDSIGEEHEDEVVFEVWRHAARSLADAHRNEFRRTFFAIFLYALHLLPAVVPQTWGVYARLSECSIAFAFAISWMNLFPRLYKIVGSLPSRRTYTSIMTQCANECTRTGQMDTANQPCGAQINGNAKQSISPIRRNLYSGGMHTYQPGKRDYLDLSGWYACQNYLMSVIAAVAVVVCGATACFVMWDDVPINFSCRNAGVLTILSLWIASTLCTSGLNMRYKGVWHETTIWRTVLAKDTVIGIGILVTHLLFTAGGWNSGWCREPYICIHPKSQFFPDTDSQYTKYAYLLYSTVAISAIVLELSYFLGVLCWARQGIKFVRWSENSVAGIGRKR
jgi:hypothetical protein